MAKKPAGLFTCFLLVTGLGGCAKTADTPTSVIHNASTKASEHAAAQLHIQQRHQCAESMLIASEDPHPASGTVWVDYKVFLANIKWQGNQNHDVSTDNCESVDGQGGSAMALVCYGPPGAGNFRMCGAVTGNYAKGTHNQSCYGYSCSELSKSTTVGGGAGRQMGLPNVSVGPIAFTGAVRAMLWLGGEEFDLTQTGNCCCKNDATELSALGEITAQGIGIGRWGVFCASANVTVKACGKAGIKAGETCGQSFGLKPVLGGYFGVGIDGLLLGRCSTDPKGSVRYSVLSPDPSCPDCYCVSAFGAQMCGLHIPHQTGTGDASACLN